MKLALYMGGAGARRGNVHDDHARHHVDGRRIGAGPRPAREPLAEALL